MTSQDKNFKLCIIGGLGHVGLPLSIKFAEKGLKVCSYDINKNAIDMVKKGKMPFIEYGSEELLLKSMSRMALRIWSKIYFFVGENILKKNLLNIIKIQNFILLEILLLKDKKVIKKKLYFC